MEMESFQVCGSIGTQKSEVRFQDRKFSKFSVTVRVAVRVRVGI